MNASLPIQYEWIKLNGYKEFTPWHFRNIEEYDSINKNFSIENAQNRRVVTFANRQDNDDAAGFEVINGKVTDCVICFHPSYSGRKEKQIINSEHKNLFMFFREVVLVDFVEWGECEFGGDMWSN